MKYFDIREFDCKETGENEMDEQFLEKLDLLRERCGFAFKINSGYRSKEHSEEILKASPGTHAQGIAADIAVTDGIRRFKLVKNALEMGFTGIGIAKTFVHVDTRNTAKVIWTY